MEKLLELLKQKEIELENLERETDRENVLEMLILVHAIAYVKGLKDALEVLKK